MLLGAIDLGIYDIDLGYSLLDGDIGCIANGIDRLGSTVYCFDECGHLGRLLAGCVGQLGC